MAVLYVKEQGACVQKMGERILVTKNGRTLLDQPVIKLTNLAVIGNVQVTTQALHLLLDRGVDISYFTCGGRYLGHAGADSSKNVFLRFEQYRFYLNEEKRLDMAKCMVRSKIRNQIAVIRSHKWLPSDEYDWKRDVAQMERHLAELEDKKTPNEILGVEGVCSSIYFCSFGQMIKGDFRFETRNRRPPKDPINILLSLAYSFLTREVGNTLESESFEPYLGFLHGIRYGRKSLALDVMEVFRQPVVDRLIILLVSKRMMNRFDFEEGDDGPPVLNEDGFRKFCTEYERWMTGRNSLAGDSFRKCIQEECARLKKAIVSGEAFEPYSWSGRHVSDQL